MHTIANSSRTKAASTAIPRSVSGTVGGTFLGALAGGGIGYALPGDKKKKKKNAIIGASTLGLAGGLAGLGHGRVRDKYDSDIQSLVDTQGTLLNIIDSFQEKERNRVLNIVDEVKPNDHVVV